MINYKDILEDKEIISMYKKIDDINEFSFSHGYKHILNVIELMKKLINVLNLKEKVSKFSSLLMFVDKMDITKNRFEENYKEKFEYEVYENIEDINFKLDNNIFILLIITNGKITAKDLLSDEKYFHNIINTTKLFTNSFGFKYKIRLDDEILDIN